MPVSMMPISTDPLPVWRSQASGASMSASATPPLWPGIMHAVEQIEGRVIGDGHRLLDVVRLGIGHIGILPEVFDGPAHAGGVLELQQHQLAAVMGLAAGLGIDRAGQLAHLPDAGGSGRLRIGEAFLPGLEGHDDAPRSIGMGVLDSA